MNAFDSYQEWTRTTAVYSNHTYPMLGLAEEVGELLGKFAKFERDVVDNYAAARELTEGVSYGAARDKLIADITKEAGDVLWQLARLLDDHNISLGSVAALNIAKLESRKHRGTINGSGDGR